MVDEASGLSYAHPLELATRVALEVGAALHAEFVLPEGPRGHGSHADIDEEVERELIRPALTSAYPKWGYRGEETRPHLLPTDTDGHVWLVDPNDGTSTYLSGHRGPAVSIGLVRDGLPVLGVVYAYSARNNRGDLLAWAEGCSFVRNGLPVEPDARSGPLQENDVITLSQAADDRADVNTACVEPSRYLTVPSIAYRLALVAAGEARAGVGLSNPGDWDYAAAHALLRAAGLILINGRGQPISYRRNGHSAVDHQGVFGGDPDAVHQLRQRMWSRVFGPRAQSETYPLVRPSRGHKESDPAVLERATGCLMGQLVGDALGSQVEFEPEHRLRSAFPDGLRTITDGGTFGTMAGQPTDDSELALMLARSIVRNHGLYAPEAAARAYAFWLESHPFDIGTTTRKALEAISRSVRLGQDPVAAAGAEADRASEANGSLMRISPLAIWGYAIPPDLLASYARQDSALTHPAMVCQDACAVFTVTLAHAIRHGPAAAELYQFALAWSRQHAPSVAPVLEAASAPAKGQPAIDGSHQGWVVHALRNAFHQVLHAASFEEGLVQTVMRGGDTDTNGAIAGALLGATHGYESIPANWRRTVLTCRPMPSREVVRPRPQPFWPVDALRLAETLLVSGREAAHRL